MALNFLKEIFWVVFRGQFDFHFTQPNLFVSPFNRIMYLFYVNLSDGVNDK